MPQSGGQFVLERPFAGVNELLSPRHIAPHELSATQNVVNRDGRIAPRPGRVPALPFSFSFVPAIQPNAPGSGVRGLAVDEAGSKLYLADETNDKITQRDLDGGSASDIVTGLNDPVDLALDVGNFLYYYNGGATSLRRVDWGTWANDAEVSSDLLASDARIALDATNSIIYSFRGLNIRKLDFSGGLPATASNLVATSISVDDIAISGDGATVYWISIGSSKIFSSSTATGAEVELVDLAATFPNVVTPKRIAIDTTNLKLYVFDSGHDTIYRCDTDGTDVEQFSTALYETNADMAAGPTAKKLYVADPNLDILVHVNTDATLGEVVSSFDLQRSVAGVPSGIFASDLRLVQVVNKTAQETDLAVWFGSTGTATDVFKRVYYLRTGYQLGSDGVHLFSTIDRDVSTPTTQAPVSTKSGRFHFTPMGAYYETGQGGVLICDGDAASDSPFVCNYVLSDSIYTFEITGTPTGGSWTITIAGIEIDAIAHNADPSSIASRADFNGVRGLDITQSGSTYTIRIHGALSGQNVTATANGDGLTGGTDPGVTVIQTQTGGLEDESFLYLRPVGLPKPVNGAGSGEVNAEIGLSSGLTGIFSYAVTWYSSRWQLESAPTELEGNVGGTVYFNLTGGDADKSMTIDLLTAVPSGMYFDLVNTPFRHVDYLKVYRRKWGATVSGTIPDGVGADQEWRYVGALNIANFPSGSFPARFNDTGLVLGVDPAPFENDYPPRNAAFAEVHDGRMYYGNARDRLIFYSSRTKQGLLNEGELGFEYVAPGQEGAFEPLGALGSDAPNTALVSLGQLLIIGTARSPIRANTAPLDFGLPPSMSTLDGVIGPASAWCVLKGDTARGPDSRGSAFWIGANGHVYETDGSIAVRISRDLQTFAAALVRKYWHDPADWTTSFNDSWHWASLAFDDLENRLIAVSYARADGALRIAAANLNNRAWTPNWTLGTARAWFGGRNQTTGVFALIFFGANGYPFVQQDGADDNGASFDWSCSTKEFSLGGGAHPKRVASGGLSLSFDVRDFAGGFPSVTITPVINKDETPVVGAKTTALSATNKQLVTTVQDGVLTLRLDVSGTQTNTLDHAELVGLGSDYEFTGLRRQA